MTKSEFLDTLRRVLNRELSEAEAYSHVNYYDTYIRGQMAQGKSEQQVLDELGDPRLIARTILQVEGQEEEAGDMRTEQTVYTEGADGSYEETYSSGSGYSDESSSPFGTQVHIHGFGWKGWLILILVLIVIFTVLGTVFAIAWRLLPVLLIAAGGMWLYRRFTSR